MQTRILEQLVGPNVSQLLPPPTANPKIGWRLLNAEGIEKKFGLSPDLVVDYLSLIGDQSDNIPGLSGVGPKTAVKWLKEWGNLEGIISNAGRISPKRFCSIVYEQRDILLRNRELIKLDDEPLMIHVEPSTPNIQEIERILSAMEMRKFLKTLGKILKINFSFGTLFSSFFLKLIDFNVSILSLTA